MIKELGDKIYATLFESSKVQISNAKVDISFDKLPEHLTEVKIAEEIKSILKKESGFARVKEAFSYDETIGSRPEIFIENQTLVTGVGLIGFIIGSVYKTAESTDAFKNNNQLTVYTDKKMAQRAFVDYVYLQTVKGGLTGCFKYVAFSGLILGSSLAIQAYRNKSTPFDYTIGGALSGSIFRMHYGLYNFLFGGFAGSIVGTIFGIAKYGQLRLTETTYEERRYKFLREKIITRETLLNSITTKDEASNIKK